MLSCYYLSGRNEDTAKLSIEVDIISIPFSKLCFAFQTIAHRTWERMADGRRTQIYLREDGFTALNLQDLYHYRGIDFEFIDFSPIEETDLSGADWEWWFIQPGGCFGAAVQAKSLKNSSYNIGYKPKKGLLQIERLFEYSRRNKIAPQYCFYNHWDLRSMAPTSWPCGSFSDNPPLWGCAIADGRAIWELHRLKKYDLVDVLPVCLPWHCIVCCPGVSIPVVPGPATRARGISELLRSKGRSVYEENRNLLRRASNRGGTLRMHKDLPERIKRARRMGVEAQYQQNAVLELWNGKPPRFLMVIGNENQGKEES